MSNTTIVRFSPELRKALLQKQRVSLIVTIIMTILVAAFFLLRTIFTAEFERLLPILEPEVYGPLALVVGVLFGSLCYHLGHFLYISYLTKRDRSKVLRIYHDEKLIAYYEKGNRINIKPQQISFYTQNESEDGVFSVVIIKLSNGRKVRISNLCENQAVLSRELKKWNIKYSWWIF